jgi:hypothetical protein
VKNTHLITQWENAVNKVDRQGNHWKARNFSRICSNHFLISDYTTTKNGSTVLKKDAVPTQSLTMNTDDDQVSQLQSMDRKELEQCLKQDSGMEPPSPMEQEGPSVRDVMRDHNYAKPPQFSQVLNQMPLVEPVKAKKTPYQYMKEVKKRKLRALQQKLRRRESKAKNMKQLINTLQKKLFIKEEEAELLHNNFDGLRLSLFNNAMKNNKAPLCGRRYSDEIKEFAVTIQYYSPKAYNFLRTIIPLPAPSLIKRWARSVDCEPGFITEALDILKSEIQGHSEKKDCCLVFDAMAIRKQTLWDPKQDEFVGFVNYGPAQIESPETMASEALVFALVGLRSHWKCPIAYFLINKLSASVQAELVRKALVLTAEIGLKVWCITSDGTSSNVATFKLLGCIFGLTYKSMITKFKHPTLGYDVFVMLDPCHMLKLARNTLASLGSIFAQNEGIHWKFLKHLNEVQENHGMKLANKLTTNHIKYEKHKMKVDLAAQTLSTSVADAIDFLNIAEKDPRFHNSEATVTFIRSVDKLFDILNSRNPLGKRSKQPLKLVNKNTWEAELLVIANYLLSLKSGDGQLLLKHKRKTFILGFVITIKSTIEMATTMLTQQVNPFKYLLTYKFSQDHIELLFSCIRARGGWNNNPNCLQLKYTLRRMLLNNSITASRNANCQILDQHSVVPVLHTRKHHSPLKDKSTTVGDDHEDDSDAHTMMQHLQAAEHSEFTMYVLHYICGFIVSKLEKRISCSQCIVAITESPSQSQERSDHDYCSKTSDNMYDNASTFTNFVNKGGLRIPSTLVLKVVSYAEQVFKCYVSSATHDSITKEKKLKEKMVTEVSHHFAEVDISKQESHEQFLNETLFDNHNLWLVKCIADQFFKLRLFTYAKTYNEIIVGKGLPSRRHQLNKLILFQNQ